MLRFNICKYCITSLLCFFISALKAQEVKTDSITPDQQLYLSAVKLVDSAKYKEALPVLKKVLKKTPSNAEAWNKMAFAKIKLKDFKGAEKDLISSDLVLPMNFETCKLKGINYYLWGNFKQAKVEFDTALYITKEDKIDDAELHYYRALLMFKGKSNKPALEALESATEINPRYVEAHILKGEIRFAMKDYKYAIKELTAAIQVMPDGKTDYSAYKIRAKANFEIGDYKAAVKDWNVYFDGVPPLEEDLVMRGSAKINAGDFSGAIVDLDAAIKVNSKNPVSYCYRGIAKGENKMFNEGLKDLDYAIKLKFDYAGAYVNRAAIKMALKDKRGACEDLTKADGLGDEMALQLVERYCKQR
jgi:tetratricopeptide (TPR) repeat protein